MLPTNFSSGLGDTFAPAAEGAIEGYVLDNMEGAVDQASFLAKLDIPIAIVGAHGTGKMYVARVVHLASGREPGNIVPIDCRAFRNRKDAIRGIQKELKHSQGKTLVFKSPHLMSADAQIKLARQIATRTLADVTPSRYLPDVKLVALFPDTIERLILFGSLSEKLASVFAGFPINVPPIKDRKQAVLRWADKILGQECARRDCDVKGFTKEAEQAMLAHDWSGNISEIRLRIGQALDVVVPQDREWLTPVDLGIYQGRVFDERAAAPVPDSFLEIVDKIPTTADEGYKPSALEQLDLALGEAVNNMLLANLIEPLGVWLSDELILAVKSRYRGNMRATADFLHTRSRNISRWMPPVEERASERNSSPLWNESRRLVGEWARDVSPNGESPLDISRNVLLSHLEKLSGEIRISTRAKIMGMSIPTYQKRVKESHGKGK